MAQNPLDDINDEINAINDTFRSIASNIEDQLSKALRNATGFERSGIKDLSERLKKDFRDLVKLSDDISDNQVDISRGLAKSADISKKIIDQEKLRNKFERDLNQATLMGNVFQEEKILHLLAEIDAQKEQLENQFEQVKIQEFSAKIAEKAREREKEQEKEKNTAIKGATNGLLKQIPALDKLTSKIQSYKGGWQEVLALVVEVGFAADEPITKLTKSLSQSKTEAMLTRYELYGMAAASGDTFVTTDKLLESTAKLGQQLGIAKVYSSDVTVEFTNLTGKMKLAEGSAAGLAKMSIMLGKSSHNVTTEALGTAQALQSQAGIQLDNKQILEETGKVSGQLLANFKGNPTAIAAAVTQAKLLGTTLEQTKKQSESLLDFQSSIENELQAELITGQQLNLERARGAALMGDQETVMKELAGQNVNFTKFSQMNVIAQKDLAAALGLSTDELSNQLAQQQFIGKSRGEVAALAGEEVAKRLEALTAQEKFNNAVLKLQDIFVKLVDGPIGMLLDKVADILGFFTGGFKTNTSDDLMSGYGNRTLSTPQGSYALNNNDTVIAGTNLFRGNDMYSGPAGALSLGGGGAVVDAIAKLGDRIDQLSERPVLARPSEFATPISIKQLQNIRRSV
jgi:hypothetical protein